MIDFLVLIATFVLGAWFVFLASWLAGIIIIETIRGETDAE
jgi:hypothetical protein